NQGLNREPSARRLERLEGD
ncbi:unnamed protein product, partial [Acanthoscelides obtectus]